MGRLGDFCCWDALSPDDITHLQRAETVIEAARVMLKVNSMNSTAREIDEAHRGVMNAVLALDALDSEEE